MKCQACNEETFMPFRCPYCGGQFCSAHRLPENHTCPRIDFARSQTQGQVMTPQSYNSYQYCYNFGQQPRRVRHITTSPKELKHISVAALLIVAIGFSIGFYGNYFGGFSFTWTLDLMAVFAAILAVSMLTHEFAHKAMAQKNGLWAEFRLTTWGTVLTFVSIFLPFRMIAPGAMMISGTLQKNEDIVHISIAGPLTNMAYSIVFFGLALTLPIGADWGLMLVFAAYINAFMAVFNLIPFGILDGYKIFSFNKKIWVLTFIPAAALAIVTFLFT
jgi:Zn-dependent protease